MQSYLLQDWTTIRGKAPGGSNPSSVAQGSACWLDLARARDAIFYIDISEKTGESMLYLETSPTRDATQFQVMTSLQVAAISTTYVRGVIAASNPSVPLARFVRWRVTYTTTADWSVSFRVSAVAFSR